LKKAGCLGVVLVLLILGYQQWRIEQLRQEIRDISGKVHVESGAKGKDKSGDPDLVTALAESERHTKNAKEYISKKKLDQAQAELNKALKKLESANTVSKDIAGDISDVLGQAGERTKRAFQKAWNDISEEAKTSKK